MTAPAPKQAAIHTNTDGRQDDFSAVCPDPAAGGAEAAFDPPFSLNEVNGIKTMRTAIRTAIFFHIKLRRTLTGRHKGSLGSSGLLSRRQ